MGDMCAFPGRHTIPSDQCTFPGRHTIPLNQADPYVALRHLPEFMTPAELKRAEPKGIYSQCFKRPGGPNPLFQDDCGPSVQDAWNPFLEDDTPGAYRRVLDVESALDKAPENRRKKPVAKKPGARSPTTDILIAYDAYGRKLIPSHKCERAFLAALEATEPADPREARIRPPNIALSEWKKIRPKNEQLIDSSRLLAFIWHFRKVVAISVIVGMAVYLVCSVM
jgi:hypothetical protein